MTVNSVDNAVPIRERGRPGDGRLRRRPAGAGHRRRERNQLTYTPLAGFAGTDSFTYRVSNATGVSPPQTVTVTVSGGALTLAPATLPGGTVDVPYGTAFSTSGGTAPYSYQLTAGALPAGLSLTTGGTLSGTPTAAGNFAFTVTTSDGAGTPLTAARNYTMTVTLPPLGFVPGGQMEIPPAGHMSCASSQRRHGSLCLHDRLGRAAGRARHERRRRCSREPPRRSASSPST
ncbi:MAG: putative Ig domain-containing protein [Sphingomonas sp.]